MEPRPDFDGHDGWAAESFLIWANQRSSERAATSLLVRIADAKAKEAMRKYGLGTETVAACESVLAIAQKGLEARAASPCATPESPSTSSGSKLDDVLTTLSAARVRTVLAASAAPPPPHLLAIGPRTRWTML